MSTAPDVLDSLDTTNAWQEELYIHLHKNPELSMQETETAAEVTRRLTSFGYVVHQIGGGVVGVMTNGDGPTVLFRADMDALPVAETTGLPYASTKTGVDADGNTVPIMHACGHDMHVAAGLGAAELLSLHKDKWAGTYIALFQPGEETAEGAQAMVDNGLLDTVPTPDVALSQHVLTTPESGKVGTTAGPVLSTAASIRITVWGKGSHGAMPHLGIDPVVLSAAIVQRLQGIVAREIAPSQFGVVTVGSLQAGFKANIIPDSATLLLNIRAYDTEVREKLIAAIQRIVNAECEASGSPKPAEFHFYDSYPLTDNDQVVSDRITDAFKAYFGADRVEELAPVPASEDFSNIPTAWGIPYTYWGFGGFTPGQTVLPNHNPGFAPALQPSLRTGTEAAVVAALSYLGKES